MNTHSQILQSWNHVLFSVWGRKGNSGLAHAHIQLYMLEHSLGMLFSLQRFLYNHAYNLSIWLCVDFIHTHAHIIDIYTFFSYTRLINLLHDCLEANPHIRTDFTHTAFRIITMLACSIPELMNMHEHKHAPAPVHDSSLSGQAISLSSMKGKEGENVIFSFKHLFCAHWVWRQVSRA